MTEIPWVQIVALLAFLILAIRGLRSQGIGARKGMRMGLIWIVIFVVAALVASMIAGDDLSRTMATPTADAPSRLT